MPRFYFLTLFRVSVWLLPLMSNSQQPSQAGGWEPSPLTGLCGDVPFSGHFSGEGSWTLLHKLRPRKPGWNPVPDGMTTCIKQTSYHWWFQLCLIHPDINGFSLDCIFMPLCKSMMDNSGIRIRAGLENVTGDADLHADYAIFPKIYINFTFF